MPAFWVEYLLVPSTPTAEIDPIGHVQAVLPCSPFIRTQIGIALEPDPRLLLVARTLTGMIPRKLGVSPSIIKAYIGYLSPRGPTLMCSLIHSLLISFLSGPSNAPIQSAEIPVHLINAELSNQPL